MSPRDRLIVAIDHPDVDSANALLGQLSGHVDRVKIGMTLFFSAGPDLVRQWVGDGWRVFVDMKCHDIPYQVGRAVGVLAEQGADLVTIHTAGGREMMKAAVDAVRGTDTLVLGVTVLTSDELNDPDLLTERTALAAATGCAGIICAAPDLPLTAPWAEQLTRVVPGTRLPGAETHDQIRVTDPRTALNNGADLLVIGRGVTATPEPILAAAELVGHLLG